MKMKKRNWSKEKLTLLIIRNADQTVKQIDAPKLLILLLSALFLLAFASIITTIMILSTANQKLAKEKEMIMQAIQDKESSLIKRDKSIQELQNEVITLTAQAQEMKSRMEQISALEQKLKEMISAYSKSDTVNTQSVHEESQPGAAPTEQDGMGGEYLEMSDTQALQAAHETNLTLQQMKVEMENLDAQLSATLKRAEETQKLLAGTPTLWPTDSTRITSKYGFRKDPIRGKIAFHTGLDIGGNYKDPVYAAADGKVIDTGRNRTDGYYILIEHPTGIKTKYMHLSSIDVKENTTVKKGERIGKMGSTGRSTGTHLHFEVWVNNQPVDPLTYIGSKH
jgi:murein DD-endopeptidase MepM/ murein hydrolase activator NlpD